MTDEEEFSVRSQLKWTRDAWSPTRTTPARGEVDSTSKRHDQPVLVQR